MVDEESLRRNRNATPQFIGALTAMVWQQMGKEHPAGPFFSLINPYHFTSAIHPPIITT